MNKCPKTFPDLFKNEQSATKRLSILLTPDYHKCTLQELVQNAKEVLDLPDTYVSDTKKKEYFMNFNKMKSVYQFQVYLTNIVMKGSNLSLKQV